MEKINRPTSFAFDVLSILPFSPLSVLPGLVRDQDDPHASPGIFGLDGPFRKAVRAGLA
jgi:hypothetical protein